MTCSLKKQQGASMVEYGIMVALIATISFAIISGIGLEVSSTFVPVNNSLDAANQQ